MNDHVNALVPSPEDIDAAIRKENPLLPRIAIRELLANALIHQDMTMTGTGPTVELFRNGWRSPTPALPWWSRRSPLPEVATVRPPCCSGRIVDYTSLLNWLTESEDMIKVGAFEAKTHLSSLLDKVAQGEDVLITRRGLPVARLVPAGQAERARTQSVIAELRALRACIKLDGLDWRELRDEGRR